MKKPNLVMIVFVGLVTLWWVVFITVDVWLAHRIYLQWKTSSYLETKGEILRSEVKADSGDDGTTYEPVFSYDYAVRGQRYGGTRYAYSSQGWSQRSAYRVVDEFPQGKIVSVYYDSSSPEKAVLKKGIGSRDFLLPFLITPFNGAALLGIYAALKILLRLTVGTGRKMNDTFPVQVDGSIVRLRISSRDPIAQSLVALLLASLLGAAAIVFYFEENLNLNSLLFLSAIYIFSMIVGGVTAFAANRSDRYNLFIDHARRVVILPRQPGKSDGPIVPFECIKKLSVVSRSDETESRSNELYLRYQNETEERSALIVSEYNWVTFFNFADELEALNLLKNRILEETGRTDLVEG